MTIPQSHIRAAANAIHGAKQEAVGGVMLPSLLSALENLQLEIQMMAFAPEKHLPNREKQYCASALNLPGGAIFAVRETPDGWWRESIDFEEDKEKQLKKLLADQEVVCGWISTPRFTEQGGWSDPNG